MRPTARLHESVKPPSVLNTSGRREVGLGRQPRIDALEVSVYVVPTDGPESDGTFDWTHTTLVVVEVDAAGRRGTGYTYADRATAVVVHETLRDVVVGSNAMNVTGTWHTMVRSVRNLGRAGIAAMAISAVDVALWDLKARLLDLPLVALLGAVRAGAALYGSGGFTSYDIAQLQRQLTQWAGQGFERVKMKVGREPLRDVERVRAARDAIGPSVELFVDANGAFDRRQAAAMAAAFAEHGVVWFEEPVSSDDLHGLRLLRDGGPAGMAIAAGEYGYEPIYFDRMLRAGAVDTLQADGSRCGGITGLLKVDALCDARNTPLSLHCAPQLHAHIACALGRLVHLEYFYDHQRIERMFFDGTLLPSAGVLTPDRSRPGLGIELKKSYAAAFAV
jgi:L-alanine-DL-glutamate epimerase-like enolase superfamily enzyme